MERSNPLRAKPQYVSCKGNTHKIEVNVVRGHGYEPILSKQTMLEMNLIKILDSD